AISVLTSVAQTGSGTVQGVVEVLAFGFSYVVDRNDVGMVEGRRGASLLDEPLAPGRVGSSLGREDLDGDGPVEVGVVSLVHHAHGALAELLQNLIMSEGFADHSFPFNLPLAPAAGCPRTTPARSGSRASQRRPARRRPT